MNMAQGVRAWHILYGLSLLMYLANASSDLYLQYMYYVNPSFMKSIASVLPPITSQVIGVLRSGLLGIMGTISIILTLIIIYLVINPSQGRVGGVSMPRKITLVILLLAQIFLGNTGFLLGLILGLVGTALMR